MNPSDGKRILYAQEALKYVPKLFTLMDRNKFSPTYGCLDREYWHYRTSDFPCGMSQEALLTLALLYKYEIPGNIYHQNDRVRELAIAAINFSMRSSHQDGTCDEYYPFERAQGAMVFSLYAATEAYLLFNEKNTSFESFFKKRGGWLIHHSEIGTLANHDAMAALSLLNVYIITKEEVYLRSAQKRLKRVLSLQSEEGWFQEYEGCDPGYLTWTIDFLAKYFKKTKDQTLLIPLKKAVEFTSYFIHPDGSFGGEYGSRNSFNFFPCGLEILGAYFPLATQICDQFLEGVQNGKRAYLDDNRSFSHHMTNYLQAYLDFFENRQGTLKRNNFEKYFKEAGLFVAQKTPYYTVISLKKGGVVKLFKDNENIYSDLGFIGQLNTGHIAVSHLLSHKKITFSPPLRVEGSFNKISYPRMTLVKFLIFRLLLFPAQFSFLYSKRIRKVLQKILILNKKNLPLQYRREFKLEEGLKIIDTIKLSGSLFFTQLSIGTDHTSIYTAISNGYQESMLKSWINLDPFLSELRQKKEITLRRHVQ